MIKQSKYDGVFVALRNILQKHSNRLSVTADSPGYYCLSVDFSAKLGKGFPVAWVNIGKAYVSYHLMPVYMFPKLLDGLSKELRARMQGKSCFNFKVVNESLFKELEQATTRGLKMSKDAGYASGK